MTSLVLWMTLASAVSGDGDDPRQAEPRPPVPGLTTVSAVESHEAAPAAAEADTDGTETLPPSVPESISSNGEDRAPPADSASSSSANGHIPADVVPADVVSESPDASAPLLSHAVKVDGVDGRHVTVGPYLSRGECHRALNAELKKVTDVYVDEYLGLPDASAHVDFDIAYIQAHLVASAPEAEDVDTSFGQMRQLSVRLKFDDEFQRAIDARWRESKVQARLLRITLGAGVGFLLLGALFGYLKLDTATHGTYSRRLQLMSAAVILTLVASGALIARWIPWL